MKLFGRSGRGDIKPDTERSPPGPVYAARAFSVCQVGADGSRKVRRCEDYRRPLHNSTIAAGVRPEHDDIEVYTQVLRLATQLGMEPEIWCHDLSDAYRAYPVRDPAEAYMLGLGCRV